MFKSKKQNAVRKKLTRKQVIGRIMSIVKLLPETVQNIPGNLRERSYWEKIFKKSEAVNQILEVLQELPAFTYMAPKKPTKEAWIKVFEKNMGLRQIPGMLRQISNYMSFMPVKKKKIRYWRDAFGKEEVVQRVRPLESDEYIPNPHRGTTTFQRFQGEATYPSFITSDTFGPLVFPSGGKIRDNIKFIPRTTLTYCRWPWAWLETGKGKFRWDIIDNALKAARAAGQTAQIRFQPYTEGVVPALPSETPEIRVNLPEWYWETGAAQSGREPDHNDPLYLKHFGDFIRAFGKRYDGHPDLESIDVAYGGFWGEGGGNCSYKTASRLVDIYLKSFKKTQLVFMIETKGLHYASKVTAKTKRHIGFRADCIGDLRNGNSPDVPSHLSWNHTFDSYPKEIVEGGVSDAWKTAPVTMETCGNVATWVMSGFDFDVIMREGYRYHTSVFMPKNVFYPEKVIEKMIEFDKKIGYRYVLRQILLPIEAKSGAGFKIETFIDNVGVAPIYRQYKMALRLSQGKKVKIVRLKKDIRTWLPGHTWFKESIIFPKGFIKGEVKAALGIVDDKDTPRVWFAIKGKTDRGWYPLTSVDVV